MTLRDLPADARADLLLGTSRDAIVAYLTIRSAAIPGGLHLVGDSAPHLIDGVTYHPIGQAIEPPEEGEVTSARLSLTLPDIDGRLGRAMRLTYGRAVVSIAWRSMAGMDLTARPRVPVDATPAPLWFLRGWTVTEVAGADGQQIGLTIAPRDIEQEPYPALRATADTAPGLFR
jgi:hypothetical protein